MINRYVSPNAARTLKVVGIILILSFLLDFAILLFPFRPTDRGWQISLATALVDRGIVPMVGLGMLIAGYAIGSSDESGSGGGLDLRLPAFILSSILGLIFLLIFPLHLNNVRQASTQTIDQITQQATQAETELQNQLGNPQAQAQLEQQQTQFRNRIGELLKDPQKLNQALQSDQIPEEEKKLLREFQKDPKSVDQFLNQQFSADGIRNRALSQIRGRREQVERQARQEAWKSGLRIGISSLLLSIGYIIIGWTGIRSMGSLSGGRK
jgi:ABC-type multidrug transport system fused ATPase/permease subunit